MQYSLPEASWQRLPRPRIVGERPRDYPSLPNPRWLGPGQNGSGGLLVTDYNERGSKDACVGPGALARVEPGALARPSARQRR